MLRNLCVALCMLAVIIHGICASDCLEVSSGPQTIKIEPYGRDSLRVRVGMWLCIIVNNYIFLMLLPVITPRSGSVFQDDLPGALIDPRTTPDTPEIYTDDDGNHIKNGNIKASVDNKGLITFSRVSDSQVTNKTCNFTNKSCNITIPFHHYRCSWKRYPEFTLIPLLTALMCGM